MLVRPSGQCAFRKGTDKRGGAALDLEASENVLQMFADGAFGEEQMPSDPGVTQPGVDEAEQLPLPVGELGDATSAAQDLDVRGVQVRPARPVAGPTRLDRRRVGRRIRRRHRP